MHELSIAMSLIDVAAEQAQRLEATIVAVHLRVGPLSGVVPEALLSAYELAREGSSLADCRLVIEPTTVTAWCPQCQRQQSIASIQSVCCPDCGIPTPDIRTGRELEICAMEIVDDPQDPAPDA